MERDGSVRFWILIVICLVIGIVSTQAQSQSDLSRLESEKTIRQILYENSVATFTGDAQTVWDNMAQRNIGFYELLYQEMIGNKTFKTQAAQMGLTDGQSFFKVSLQAHAKKAYGAMTKEEIAEKARKYSASSITFINDQDAKIETETGILRAIQEDKEWKIDSTEQLKKTFAQLPLLSKVSREKIEKY